MDLQYPSSLPPQTSSLKKHPLPPFPSPHLLAAAAAPDANPHRRGETTPYNPLFPAPYHLSTTTTTSTSSSRHCSSYDPTAQFLPSHSHHHRLLSHALTSPSPHPVRFAAASGLAASSPALRPFASILLAALLPGASPDLLAWYGSRGGSGRYAALHAFLAAGMASEAFDVLARVRRGGKTPSLSGLASLLRLLFRGGEVRTAWKVFEEMAARGPRPSLATFNAMILGFCHRGLVRVGAGLLTVMGRFRRLRILPETPLQGSPHPRPEEINHQREETAQTHLRLRSPRDRFGPMGWRWHDGDGDGGRGLGDVPDLAGCGGGGGEGAHCATHRVVQSRCHTEEVEPGRFVRKCEKTERLLRDCVGRPSELVESKTENTEEDVTDEIKGALHPLGFPTKKLSG